MKKKYEAPEVEVIRYSLHEAIAAGCANKVFNHTTEGCQDDPTDFAWHGCDICRGHLWQRRFTGILLLYFQSGVI